MSGFTPLAIAAAASVAIGAAESTTVTPAGRKRLTKAEFENAWMNDCLGEGYDIAWP